MTRTVVIVALIATFLSAPAARATLISLDFSGEIAEMNDPNFAGLVAAGDSVDGSIVFDTPFDSFFLDPEPQSFYTLPAVTVSGPFTEQSATNVFHQFGKNPFTTFDPGLDLGGGQRIVLAGLSFETAVIFNALSTSDFLSLGLTDITNLSLIGWLVDNNISIASPSLFPVRLRSVSFSTAVPEPAVVALFALALLCLCAVRLRTGSRAFPTDA